MCPQDTLPARFGAHCQLLPTGALAAHDTGEPGTTRTLWETRNSTTDLSDIRGQPVRKATCQNQGQKSKARTQTKNQDPNQSPRAKAKPRIQTKTQDPNQSPGSKTKTRIQDKAHDPRQSPGTKTKPKTQTKCDVSRTNSNTVCCGAEGRSANW